MERVCIKDFTNIKFAMTEKTEVDPFEKLWINKKCSLRKKLFSSKIQISK